jgi:outer membrane receptor protein involved in Fe transport
MARRQRRFTFRCRSRLAIAVIVPAAIAAFESPAFAQPATPTDAGDQESAVAILPAAQDLSLQELLDVDVTTASKFAEKQSDAPGIVSVLSADDIKRFGGTTLSDILARVPGLNASSGYLTDRSTIAARGDQVRFNSGHILLLINGRPVRETMEGGLSSDMFERFPVGAIDHIEVIKGPGSVLYGSDAFSGVINVVTKKADGTGASAAGLIGTDGHTAAFDPSGTATLNAGDLNVLVSGRYLQQPRWQADYLFRSTPTSSVQTLPIDGPDKGSGAYFDANYKGLRLMAAYADWNYWYQLKGNISDGTWAKTFVNLGSSYKLAEHWKSDLNVGYTNSQLNFSNNRPFVKRNSSEFITEWTNFVDLFQNARIVVGGLLTSRSGKETSTAPTPTVTDDAVQLGFQAYAQMDVRPLAFAKLIGGVQTSKVGSLPVDAVPRVGVVVSPTSRVDVKGLFSQAYRAPAIDELFLQDPNLHGNPNLKPEKVSTFDVGASYRGERVQLGASYFYSKQIDIIRPAVAPGASGTNALQIYSNTSGVEIQGGEIEGKAYVNKEIYLTASALYQRSVNDQGQVGVTPIPSFSAKAGVSYMSESGLNASLFDIFEGSYASQFQGTLNPAPKPHNELNLHAVMDINKWFALRFQPGVAVQLQVNNLLDDKYYVPEWGGTVHDSLPGSIGRVVYGGVRLSL